MTDAGVIFLDSWRDGPTSWKMCGTSLRVGRKPLWYKPTQNTYIFQNVQKPLA